MSVRPGQGFSGETFASRACTYLLRIIRGQKLSLWKSTMSPYLYFCFWSNLPWHLRSFDARSQKCSSSEAKTRFRWQSKTASQSEKRRLQDSNPDSRPGCPGRRWSGRRSSGRSRSRRGFESVRRRSIEQRLKTGWLSRNFYEPGWLRWWWIPRKFEPKGHKKCQGCIRDKA